MATMKTKEGEAASAGAADSGLKVGIIGGGMAGLCCGWLLSSDSEVRVTLFERYARPGLGHHSFSVTSEENITVDIPQRAFVAGYYQELMSLYDTLSVDMITTNGAGAYCDADTRKSLFKYRNFIIKNISIPYVSLNLSTVSNVTQFFTVLFDIFRFSRQVRKDQKIGKLKDISFGDYLVANGFSDTFINNFIIPFFTIVCTCSCQSVKNYPAEILGEWFCIPSWRKMGLKKVKNGIEEIVDKLTKNIEDIRCNSSIKSIHSFTTKDGKTKVVITHPDDHEEIFDHVIIATQANHALSLLKNPLPEHISSLSSFVHEKSDVVLHRDENLMPINKADWSPLNIFSSSKNPECMGTIWQNCVQPDLKENLFQTWNPIIYTPRPDTVLTKATFERPVVTLESEKHLKVLENLQGKGNVWFCGAYSLRGIPLLENACNSGLNLAERIGKVRRPWQPRRSDASEGGESFRLFLLSCAISIAIVSALIRMMFPF